jgi:phosphatidylserine decarboxylase
MAIGSDLHPPGPYRTAGPQMKFDSAGFPFVAIAALPSAIALWLHAPVIAAVLALLPLAVLLFFRDPDRSSPLDADVVLSPADGRVMHAGPARPDEAPPGDWKQITIFLSVLDVHVNRTPVSGRIVRVEYQPGSFLPAYRHDSHRNERSEIWIDHAGVTIVVRQVVGLLARRVVCRLKAGQFVQPGERIGLMKFGSRMDVFVPSSATVRVEKGQMVQAGITVIANLA